MKTLGLDLDNSPHVAEDKSLRYALNVAIDKKGESYFNDPGFDFKTSLPEDHGNMTIIGTIPTNIGVVLFCYIDNGNYDSAILYYTTDNDVELKKIILGNFNFSIDHPIHGDYIYNYQEELIVTFTEGLESDNETRIINIYNPSYKEFANDEYWYDDNNKLFEVTSNNVTKYNLIPNVLFPTINLNVIGGGNLQTGAYQVSIAYKLYDGTYTNFSTLSPVSVISGDYESYNRVGEYVNNAIEVQLLNLDNGYEYFKLAIVYIDEESQIPYETEDIKINNYDNQSYIISSLKSYAQISLDDIFIKNISYIKDQTLINFNNRLIRANVRTLDINKYDDTLKDIANNIRMKVYSKSLEDYYNTDRRYFKGNELYVIYIAFYDYKGDLINIYNIPAKDIDENYTIPETSGNVIAHKIPDNIVEPATLSDTRSASSEELQDARLQLSMFKYSTYNLETTTESGRNFKYLGYTQPREELRYSYKIEPTWFFAEQYGLHTDIHSYINGFKIINTSNVDLTFILKVNTAIKLNANIGDQIQYEICLTELKYDSNRNGIAEDILTFSDFAEFINEENLQYEINNVLEYGAFIVPPNSEKRYAYRTYIEHNRLNTNNNPFAYSGETAFIDPIVENLPNDIPIPTYDTSFIKTLSPEFTEEALALLTPDIAKHIKSYQFLFIEHDVNNSKILSQAFMMRDTGINAFSNNQRYDYQFAGFTNESHGLIGHNAFGFTMGNGIKDVPPEDALIPYRLYPFEFLYNKIDQFKAKINLKYTYDSNNITSNLAFRFNYKELDERYKVIQVASGRDSSTKPIFNYYYDGLNKSDPNNAFVHHQNELTYNEEAIKLLYADAKSLALSDRLNEAYSTKNNIANIQYVNHNNSNQENTAGDSHYRFSQLKSEAPESKLVKYSYGSIVELENPNTDLYSDVNNQSLQIASPLYHIDNISNDNTIVELIGDTYISQLTLRATTPARGYLYGDNNNKSFDSNNYVWRWVFSVPIESKYNIKARFNFTAVDRSFKPTSADDPILKQLFNINYQIDNFINTSEGKGYSPIYNENGIEKFTYYPELTGTNNHPFRIIRSQEINAETLNLNWRLFKSNDYKDMPFNRGDIISLKTDNKTLYIQQRYGLNILQLRDTLSNTDEGTSYLESADIFNMDPVELLFSPTGYIGCENYFDTHLNAIGYFVVDVIHKNIFAIKGKEIQMISASNMKHWFAKNLKDNLNNPYKNNGRIWAFNEDTNTLYLAQHSHNENGNEDGSFTLSYSPIKNIWISFHTFIPTTGFSTRNGLFWVKNRQIFKVSKSNFGKYFEDSQEDANSSILNIVCNVEPFTNKLIHTIIWKDRVDTVDSNLIQSNNFHKTIRDILIYNDHQCTGYQPVESNNKWYDGSEGVNRVNLWRFNNIGDKLNIDYRNKEFINIDSLHGIGILDNNALNHGIKWYQINRFICQFINVVMTYDNSENANNRWELIDVMPEWIKDNRNK